MRVKNKASRIGAIMRHRLALRFEIAKTSTDQIGIARSPETIAQHELRCFSLARLAAQRRHGMKIQQQRGAPAVADLREFARYCSVIGSMDSINPTIQFLTWQRAAPDLPKARQAPWNEPEATTRTSVGL